MVESQAGWLKWSVEMTVDILWDWDLQQLMRMKMFEQRFKT
jgi:hypothetical protein